MIRDATFMVRPSGRMYMVSNNKGHHHYNGGYIGFDKVPSTTYYKEGFIGKVSSHMEL